MHLFILATFAFLVSSVAAGGLRNGYERVWLWYAYQIDLELPEDQRKIGIRCIEWSTTLNTCPDKRPEKDKKGNLTGKEISNFAPCKGSRPDKTCYFFEFMGHIDKIGSQLRQNFWQPVSYPDTTEWKTDRSKAAKVIEEQKNLSPDPKATAEWLDTSHGPDNGWNPVRTKIYVPYRAFKGASKVYNPMLRMIADHSANTIAGFTADQRTRNQANIDAIKTSLRGVSVERAIDHSKKIIEANDSLAKKFTLFTYTEAGFNGNIVDWDKSAALQTGDDIARFDAWKTTYYSDAKALDHVTVMDDFKYVEAKYSPPAACAGP